MKASALTLSVVALFLGASAVLAQAPVDEHAGHRPAGAPPPPASPAAQSPAQGMGAAAMPRMRDNMKKMQELMAKIHASKDPAERQQLMQQHSRAMHEQMQMMQAMGGGQDGMMGGGMKMGGGMQGGASPPAGAQGGPPPGEGMMNHEMMMNHQAMQARMGMMEMMMGQMLQHQEAQQEPKAAK
jgi:hypothetical protein